MFGLVLRLGRDPKHDPLRIDLPHELIKFRRLKIDDHALAGLLDLLDQRNPLENGQVLADALRPLDGREIGQREDRVQVLRPRPGRPCGTRCDRKVRLPAG